MLLEDGIRGLLDDDGGRNLDQDMMLSSKYFRKDADMIVGFLSSLRLSLLCPESWLVGL